MRSLVAAVLVATCTSSLPAQVAQPAGVTTRMLVVAPDAGNSALPRSTVAEPPLTRESVWPWVGVGALAGALVGGVAMAMEYQPGNSYISSPLFVGVGVAGGALVGAVTGAVLHAIVRPASAQSPDPHPESE